MDAWNAPPFTAVAGFEIVALPFFDPLFAVECLVSFTRHV